MTIELSGCLIVDNSDRLLLIHRNTPEITWWEIIGGKIEPKELSEYAAVREAREEAGVIVKSLSDCLYSHTFTYNGTSYLQDVWRTPIMSGKPTAMEPVHDSVEWFGVRQLRMMEDLSPGLRHLVKAVVDGEVQL